MYPYPQSLAVHAYIAHPCRLHGFKVVATGRGENHFGSQKTSKAGAYLCSFPKLLQTHSVHQILYYKSRFIQQLKL